MRILPSWYAIAYVIIGGLQVMVLAYSALGSSAVFS